MSERPSLSLPLSVALLSVPAIIFRLRIPCAASSDSIELYAATSTMRTVPWLAPAHRLNHANKYTPQKARLSSDSSQGLKARTAGRLARAIVKTSSSPNGGKSARKCASSNQVASRSRRIADGNVFHSLVADTFPFPFFNNGYEHFDPGIVARSTHKEVALVDDISWQSLRIFMATSLSLLFSCSALACLARSFCLHAASAGEGLPLALALYYHLFPGHLRRRFIRLPAPTRK